jgi:hypothetical protein
LQTLGYRFQAFPGLRVAGVGGGLEAVMMQQKRVVGEGGSCRPVFHAQRQNRLLQGIGVGWQLGQDTGQNAGGRRFVVASAFGGDLLAEGDLQRAVGQRLFLGRGPCQFGIEGREVSAQLLRRVGRAGVVVG